MREREGAAARAAALEGELAQLKATSGAAAVELPKVVQDLVAAKAAVAEAKKQQGEAEAKVRRGAEEMAAKVEEIMKLKREVAKLSEKK